jgi:4-amino-4-deoxy-L-arabinose transferase-like glycosyltransferase
MKESSQRTRQILFSILALAFLIRIAAVPLAHRGGYISDEKEYIFLAHQLNEGKGFVDSNGEYSIKVPAYPVVMALCFRLWPSSLILPFLIGALAATLSIYVGYLLALRIWQNDSTALWSAGFMAFFPPLVLYGGLLMTESLFILLVLLMLLLAHRLCRDDSYLLHLLLGIVAGVAVLTRAAAFGLFPVLLVLLWIERRKSGLPSRGLLVAFGVWCIVLLPWSVRNYSVHQEIIPVSTFGGRAVLTGSNPFAHGTAKLDPGFAGWLDERLSERGLDPGEAGPEGRRVSAEQSIALEYARTHPGRLLILAMQKAFVFWIYPVTYGQDNRAFQASFMAFDILLLLGTLCGAVAAGSLRVSFSILATPVFYFTAMSMLLYAEARFRIPAMPLLCIIAAGSTNLLDAEWRRRVVAHASNRRVLIGGIVLVVALYALAATLFLGGRIA